jgi:predicted transcriptional regulator/sporulation protein YlmC with PRC-barrel domain
MENTPNAIVGDLVTASLETITPDETVTVAKRRMESQTARSLIVVEAERPVGIIQWRGLNRHDGDTLIREVMQTAFPVLTADMPVSEVRGQLSELDVDLDHLPVVDQTGALIGEVPRGLITKMEVATSSATDQVISGPEADRDTPALHLQQGMKVIGAAGNKLGTVDEVDLNPDGKIAHFTVKYGMLGRHSKRLPADVIRSVDGDSVNLSLDQMEFKMLADVGQVY